MCIAIKIDIVCGETCQDLLLSRMVLYYELFKKHIEMKQKEIGPDVYENLVETAIKWQGIRNRKYKKSLVRTSDVYEVN